jgi:hypothetical protein
MKDKNNKKLFPGNKVLFWNNSASHYMGLETHPPWLLGEVAPHQDYEYEYDDGFIVRVSFGHKGVWNCDKNCLEKLTKEQYVLRKFEE